jgi:cell division protein FtsA
MGERAVPDQYIVGIDIGTSKLCSAVAIREASGALRYVGHGSTPSGGLKNGDIVDVAGLGAAFVRAVEEARYLIGAPVHDIVVSMSGMRMEAIDRSGGVSLTLGRPVTQEDVARAIGSARGLDPPGVQPIHRVVRSIVLDGERVDDPLGKSGTRLDVRVRDYAVSSVLVDRLRQVGDASAVRVHSLVPGGVASAASTLTDEERRNGVALVDIGSGTTDIAIYAGGELRHLATFPAGGNHVTTDIASILDVPLDEAERLKRRYGAIGEDTDEELITDWTPRTIAMLQRMASEGDIPAYAVRSIAGARVIQIIDRVREILAQTEAGSTLRSGVVLTGGGSQLHGVSDIASAILHLPVRSGAVLATEGFPAIADPGGCGSVGLVRYVAARAEPANGTQPQPVGRGSGFGVSGIVHPSVARSMPRREGRSPGRSDTIDVISAPNGHYANPRPRSRQASSTWGRTFRDWMRELVPRHVDD